MASHIALTVLICIFVSMEEMFHVGQILERGYPSSPAAFDAYEQESKSALNEWWDTHPLNPQMAP